MDRFELSDLGNGRRFARDHAGTVRHVRAWNAWLVWDGRRWVKGDESAAEKAAKATALRIGQEAEGHQDPKAVLKWAMKSQDRGALASMLAMARSEDGIAMRAEELDIDAWSFNVLNGTIDLHTGQLRPHEPDDKVTKLAPVTFDPGATCPRWLAFLERVVPDPATRTFLQLAVGYSLTGDVREHALFFLHGGGRNGKSTFVETIMALMGEYGSAGAPDLLLAKGGDRHPTEQADLFGARFVSCQEVEQDRSWAESTLKRLTGGDRIKARRMHQDFWEFPPTHKFWVSGNHKPRVRGGDEGIWRRMKLIPFTVQIPTAEQDKELKEKLRAEFSGILNWAIAGCQVWQRDGLSDPPKVTEATTEYRTQESVLGAFLDEKCTRAPGGVQDRARLYHAYAVWCGLHRERQLGRSEFYNQLELQGFRQKIVNGCRMVEGVTIKGSA